MTIRHHPSDDYLLALATGHLPTGPRLVTASHVEGCDRCRALVRTLEAAGGAFIEDLPGATLAPEALARTLEAIDRPQPASTSGRSLTAIAPALPPGTRWPHALRGCRPSRWWWIGPGMRFARVRVPYDRRANVFLLRIAAGKRLPRHTHTHSEVTQVLHGRFDDGRALYAAGDFDAADQSIHHQPVVQGDGECVCLASVEGRVRFDGVVARAFGAIVRM